MWLSSTDTPIQADPDFWLEEIKRKSWWQGSVIQAGNIPTSLKVQPDYWVIASQACNIYNHDFNKIPLIELVGGKDVVTRDAVKARGENPRVLHVLALSEGQGVSIELDIMTRHWIPREVLARIPSSPMRLRKTAFDAPKGKEIDWNDLFSTWLSRSYTRIALPDDFNSAIRNSKIEKVIDTKLINKSADIHGIYFSIDSDADEYVGDSLGEMKPPYVLGIVIIVHEHADSVEINNSFVRQLFEENQTDPNGSEKKVSRVELAKRLGVRILKEGIESRSITEVTLHELKSLVRFSMSDHLSDSSEIIH